MSPPEFACYAITQEHRPTISCSRSNTLQSPNVSCNHSTQVHRATACFPCRSAARGEALGFTKSNTMAIAPKCWLSEEKPVSSLAMDMIGVTAIPLSSVPPPTSAANRQSLMARPLSRTATALPILRH